MQAPVTTVAAEHSAVLEAKKTMRAQIKKQLKAMSSDDMRQQSSQIAQQVIASSFFRQARSVALYITCERLREVDTMALLQAALQQGKQCFVPLVEDSQSNMALLHIDTLDDLQPAPPFGILEPSKQQRYGSDRQNALQVAGGLDLLLMPGLGFDREGGRLGRGGGYYDKMVHALDARAQQHGWQPPWLVALAFSQQLVQQVPTSHHDRDVDVLAMPTGLLRCSSRAKQHL
uniref:5-formyltetrahydrofolate cyclo-ligase n=1 Tax=Tetradesmus obliquus TaxID=3088 RepID=A0A383V9D9_TETOB|eukprot:jgi/Sobl393_1/16274/SZX61560.1